MDALFSREVGPSYVPSFAARLVLSMGKGVQRAGGELKKAFDEDFKGMWALSMVVIQWYADQLPPTEAKAVAAALQEFDMIAVASNLNLFRERLLPFVRTAHTAQDEAQLAAAGAYFVAAVEQIGLRLLSAALQAAPLHALQQRILVRLPPPTGLKEEYERLLSTDNGAPAAGSAPPRPAQAPRASRADRFDRADFERPVPRAQNRVAPSSVTPPRPPVPNLDEATVTQAFLFTLGWESVEVERIVSGPSGASAPKPAPRIVDGKRIA